MYNVDVATVHIFSLVSRDGDWSLTRRKPNTALEMPALVCEESKVLHGIILLVPGFRTNHDLRDNSISYSTEDLAQDDFVMRGQTSSPVNVWDLVW